MNRRNFLTNILAGLSTILLPISLITNKRNRWVEVESDIRRVYTKCGENEAFVGLCLINTKNAENSLTVQNQLDDCHKMFRDHYNKEGHGLVVYSKQPNNCSKFGIIVGDVPLEITRMV